MKYFHENYVAKILSQLNESKSLLERCRNASGRLEIGLYEDVQVFLHNNTPAPGKLEVIDKPNDH